MDYITCDSSHVPSKCTVKRVQTAFDILHREKLGYAPQSYSYVDLGQQFLVAEVANIVQPAYKHKMVRSMTAVSGTNVKPTGIQRMYIPKLAEVSRHFKALWSDKAARFDIINSYARLPKGPDEVEFEVEIFKWMDHRDGVNLADATYKSIVDLAEGSVIEDVQIETHHVRTMPHTEPIYTLVFSNPNEPRKAWIPSTGSRRIGLVHLRLFNEEYIERRKHFKNVDVSGRINTRVWTTWNRTSKK